MEPAQVLLGAWLCAPLEVISRIWIQSSWLRLDELSQKNSLLMRDSNPGVRINRFGRSTIRVSYSTWKHLSGFLQVLEILGNAVILMCFFKVGKMLETAFILIHFYFFILIVCLLDKEVKLIGEKNRKEKQTIMQSSTTSPLNRSSILNILLN